MIHPTLRTTRRTLLGTGSLLAASTLAACATGGGGISSGGRTIVLVHGAFLGAWAMQPAIDELAARGRHAVALDLPGHGVQARFPASYFKRPLDDAAFGTEPSPVAAITLDDHVAAVTQVVDAAIKASGGPVVLVGHSMAGVILSALAEKSPEKVSKLVYVTAFMPANGTPAGAYIGAPENAGEKVGKLLKADPGKVGALRIDMRSADATYAAAAKEAFFNDVPDDRWPAVRNLLVPDVAARTFGTPLTLTAARWGSVKRAYVRCTQDNAVRIALQDRFIREADAATPGNATQQLTLATGHSPFLSNPKAFADALLQATA